MCSLSGLTTKGQPIFLLGLSARWHESSSSADPPRMGWIRTRVEGLVQKMTETRADYVLSVSSLKLAEELNDREGTSMGALKPAHGGELKNLILGPRSSGGKGRSKDFETWDLTPRQLCESSLS